MKMSRVYLTLISAAALPNAAASETYRTCPIERALYEAAAGPQLMLRFVSLPVAAQVINNLSLHIRGQSKQAELWYFFDQGSIPSISLISTTSPIKPGWQADKSIRPHGIATFIGIDTNGKIIEESPRAGSKAPRYVIIPELAQVYKSVGLNGYHASAFVLKKCAA